MNKLDQTVDDYLKDIEASCLRLLFTMHEGPEAVWGELMRMESAGHAFKEGCSRPRGGQAAQILPLVEALRLRMAKDGLQDYEEFAAFRQGVSNLQHCVGQLRSSLGAKTPRSKGRLKTCVFYCSNHVEARSLAALDGGGDSIKTIGLPCSGKVDVPYLVKALETGADAVVVVACKKQECRHFEGSARAHKRAEAVESLLKEIGLGTGRVAVIECPQGGTRRVGDQIFEFCEQVRNLPQVCVPGGAKNPPELMVA